MKFLLALILCSCTASAKGRSTLALSNLTAEDVVVFVAFGADSVVTSWPTCPPTTRLNCQMTLTASTFVDLPLGGQYVNATVSFGQPPSCGSTKAEVNLNNPKWFDTVDISLVDGFNKKVSIEAGPTTLGPVKGPTGNEKALGVYPLGCDVCVARQNPPCGMKPGKDGCKAGPDQYHPAVPCQFQGAVKGGGTSVLVKYHG